MFIGIISDTHDRLARTTRAVKLLDEAQVEAIIHCGDICGTDILALFAGTPLYYVMGNNDDDAELRSASKVMENLHYLHQGAIIELAGKRIGVTHGHLHRVVSDLIRQKPDYLLSGHTHFATNEMHQGIHCINPGALHRASEYSVATFDLLTDELRFLPVPSSYSE
jgi:uncharacterized protein